MKPFLIGFFIVPFGMCIMFLPLIVIFIIGHNDSIYGYINMFWLCFLCGIFYKWGKE